MQELCEVILEFDETDVATLNDDELGSWRERFADAARESAAGEVSSDLARLVQDAVDIVQSIDVETENRAALVASARAFTDAALAKLDEGAAATRVAGASGRRALALNAARNAVRVPERHRPRVEPTPHARIGRPGGNDYPSLIAAAEDFGKLVDNVERNVIRLGEGERVTALQIDWRDTYPEDRRLRGNDLETTTERMLSHRDSLLASGGVPGPSESKYSELVFGQTKRPVRDGLPSFLSSRGELTWNVPATLDDVVVANTGGAVGVVTNQQDIDGTTKTYQDVANPGHASATVRAIYTRLQFSNATSRFLPERMASMMQLATVAHAREAERGLLVDIKAGSVKWTNNEVAFGAYRDLKRQVLAVVEELRDHLRDDSVPITAIFPDFLPAMLASDLLAQQAGDSSWDITPARMRSDIVSWGLNPIFTDESIRGRLLATPTGGARSVSYDADLEWAVFPAATWLCLDAGQLDLGLVRDSSLNSTNKLQTFSENFEAIAKVGAYSYWITSSLCASGDAQVATDIASCSPAGS